MEIKFLGDVHYLSGKLDEFVDLEVLDHAKHPLKLNLRAITSINSNGLRKFLAFVLKSPQREMQLYDCTTEFIANVNVIPQILGQPPNPTRIKSLFVPLSCESCDKSQSHLINLDEIKQTHEGQWFMSAVRCDRCGNPMVCDVEPAEYFIFMEDAS